MEPFGQQVFRRCCALASRRYRLAHLHTSHHFHPPSLAPHRTPTPITTHHLEPPPITPTTPLLNAHAHHPPTRPLARPPLISSPPATHTSSRWPRTQLMTQTVFEHGPNPCIFHAGVRRPAQSSRSIVTRRRTQTRTALSCPRPSGSCTRRYQRHPPATRPSAPHGQPRCPSTRLHGGSPTSRASPASGPRLWLSHRPEDRHGPLGVPPLPPPPPGVVFLRTPPRQPRSPLSRPTPCSPLC